MANLIKGLLGSRPAAGTVGRRFAATDTGKLYYDTGSIWEADGSDNALLTVAGGVSTKTSSYTAVLGDSGSLLVLNSGSSITLTLPATPPHSLWFVEVQCIGAGSATISRNGLNIDGAASDVILSSGQGLRIFTDGLNYFTMRGGPSILTTKGDLLTRSSTADTRLGVGADAQVLTADSSQAGGIKWADPAGGSSLPGKPYADWSWVTQGTATLDTTNNQIGVMTPSGYEPWRLLQQDIPSPGSDWTASDCVMFSGILQDNFISVGIGVKETGSTGKFITWKIANSQGCAVTTYTGITGGVSNVFGPLGMITGNAPGWYRIGKTGTNYYFEYGINGPQWLTLFTYGLATWVGSSFRPRERDANSKSNGIPRRPRLLFARALFANSQGTCMKLLFRDGSGLWDCAKRLEKRGIEAWILRSQEELTLLAGGMNITETQLRAGHRNQSISYNAGRNYFCPKSYPSRHYGGYP